LPDHLWVPDSVRDVIRDLPPEFRKAARLAIMVLADDPVPPDARAFADLPGAYELDVDGVITIFYVVSGPDVMIQVVRPNS
jgi:hypothetical protein